MKKNFHYIEFSRPNASVLKLLKALDENKNNVKRFIFHLFKGNFNFLINKKGMMHGHVSKEMSHIEKGHRKLWLCAVVLCRRSRDASMRALGL